MQRQVLSWSAPPTAASCRPTTRGRSGARRTNVAAAVKKYPARFSGLATLPTANIAWAAEELERRTELGLIGAVLPLDAFVTLAGARTLAPIFAVAQKHRSHLFVHRGRPPRHPGQALETGATNVYFGLPLPAPRAQPPRLRGRQRAGTHAPDHGDAPRDRRHHARAHRFSRRLSRRECSGRDDGQRHLAVAEQIQMAAEEAGKPVPAKRFRSVYLDTGQSGRGPRGIALAAKVFGADRLLFGSDSGPTESIVPTVESVKQAALTADEKALIFSGNGLRLPRRKASERAELGDRMAPSPMGYHWRSRGRFPSDGYSARTRADIFCQVSRRVSVVPTYNRAELIRRSSVLHQTAPVHEIIVVDDEHGLHVRARGRLWRSGHPPATRSSRRRRGAQSRPCASDRRLDCAARFIRRLGVYQDRAATAISRSASALRFRPFRLLRIRRS